MGFLLRIIAKTKWYIEDVPWLLEGDLQADALGDLKTKENKLSLWHVEDDRSNFARLVTALAAARQKPDKFDYALINVEVVDEIDIRRIRSDGDSPDDHVNGTWHWDLYELTAQKLLAFALRIRQHGIIDRVKEKDIKNWLVDGVTQRRFQRDRVAPSMVENLDQLLQARGLDWPEPPL
jgi:hypothetical protein